MSRRSMLVFLVFSWWLCHLRRVQVFYLSPHPRQLCRAVWYGDVSTERPTFSSLSRFQCRPSPVPVVVPWLSSSHHRWLRGPRCSGSSWDSRTGHPEEKAVGREWPWLLSSGFTQAMMPEHYLLPDFENSAIQGYLMLMLMIWHFEREVNTCHLPKGRQFGDVPTPNLKSRLPGRW